MNQHNTLGYIQVTFLDVQVTRSDIC